MPTLILTMAVGPEASSPTIPGVRHPILRFVVIEGILFQKQDYAGVRHSILRFVFADEHLNDAIGLLRAYNSGNRVADTAGGFNSLVSLCTMLHVRMPRRLRRR